MQFLTSAPNFRGSADPADPTFPSSWVLEVLVRSSVRRAYITQLMMNVGFTVFWRERKNEQSVCQ